MEAKEVKRVFSGIQPTGEIHLGNYLGAIKHWVRILGDFDCIYCIVDYHAMTVPYDPREMSQRILDAALINIACGLDPQRCTLFVQSHVPEHTELAWIFNCITPIGDLERMTQFKQKAQQHKEHVNAGLLDYPVLQAADILLYKAEVVPVGVDQVQHVELTREIARRFNQKFGHVFPEPQAMISPTPKILGLDGKAKMSKTLNNYIGLLEPPQVIWEKLRTAATDVHRVRRSDPGHPDECNIFTMHMALSSEDTVEWARGGCQSASIGCIDCKKVLFEHMMDELTPIQEKARVLRHDPSLVKDALSIGAKRCKEIASVVMEEVREKAGLLPLSRLQES